MNNIKKILLCVPLILAGCLSLQAPAVFSPSVCDSKKMWLPADVPDRTVFRAAVIRESEAAHKECYARIQKAFEANQKAVEENARQARQVRHDSFFGGVISLSLVELIIFILLH